MGQNFDRCIKCPCVGTIKAILTFTKLSLWQNTLLNDSFYGYAQLSIATKIGNLKTQQISSQQIH